MRLISGKLEMENIGGGVVKAGAGAGWATTNWQPFGDSKFLFPFLLWCPSFSRFGQAWPLVPNAYRLEKKSVGLVGGAKYVRHWYSTTRALVNHEMYLNECTAAADKDKKWKLRCSSRKCSKSPCGEHR